MLTELRQSQSPGQAEARDVLQQLRALRLFRGSPALFWSAFVRQSALLCKAPFGCVLQANADGEWHCLAQDASESYSQDQLDAIWRVALDLTGRALKQDFAYEPVPTPLQPQQHPVVLLLPLDTGGTGQALLALLLDKHKEQVFREALVRSQLIADIPRVLGPRSASETTSPMPAGVALPFAAPAKEPAADLLAQVLDLNAVLLRQTRFGAAAMSLVNELAARFGCSRVSLGWRLGEYLEPIAISHMDRFEPKTDACQDLRAVLDECLDQDEELLWPESEAGGAVLLAHGRYAHLHHCAHLLSLPLRGTDGPIAVLLCERDRAFSTEECRALRLSLDQVQPWLQDLQQRDRWFGARWRDALRQSLQALLGPERTLLKVGSGLAAVALLVLLFGTWPYKVELAASLETDQVAFVAAPFDGHVSGVSVHAGDWVEAAAPLLQLDDQELLLKQAEAHADVQRYSREAEKARAAAAYADMRIAEARQAQALASYDRMKFYLAQSTVKAPFAGVVVEGDKERLLGAPVSKGDMVFKISQIDGLYAKLLVSEQDVRQLQVGDRGELALLSRPEERFALEVTDIIPVAEAKPQEGNVFVVKAKLDGEVLNWWRPGMSGLAKIEVGNRRIFWILTHRLNDFLALYLWW